MNKLVSLTFIEFKDFSEVGKCFEAERCSQRNTAAQNADSEEPDPAVASPPGTSHPALSAMAHREYG
ncbi:MFS-type transporter 1 [Dissostichus eleginoides]|uniref:MFS-type transporter 1 n=1 Tax=Dissostichus eleginoides TaxID=100907 RepID=A0AAD9CQV4_DISEL|nr:MFS-type transporter 1 [Dissostichus eleginoides]